MTTDTTSGRIDQQLSSCPFCSLLYNQQTRTAIESCARCQLPLLPANPRLELLDDYLSYLRRLQDRQSQWRGTQYHEKVQAQIAKVEQMKAQSKARYPQPSNYTAGARNQTDVAPSVLNPSKSVQSVSGQVPSGLETRVQILATHYTKFDVLVKVFHDRLENIAKQVCDLSTQFEERSEASSPASQDLSDVRDTLNKLQGQVQTLQNAIADLKAVLHLDQVAQLPKLLSKIDSLEKELRKEKEYRKHLELHFSDRIHHITQAFEELKAGQVPKAPPKPVPENDPRTPWWLERYHLSPQDILPLANSVEETSDSFARRNGHARVQGNGKGAIAFEKQSGNSKFWIILSDNSLDGQKIAYLVPRPSIKFNGYEQQSIQAYFELDEAEGQSNGQYQVTRPAIVTALSQGGQWELLERGLLELLSKNDLEEDHA